jgi:hypothetical protein
MSKNNKNLPTTSFFFNPVLTEELVMRTREMLTDEPESALLPREQLIAVIPIAISEWQKKIVKDRAQLEAFRVETGEITIADGVADLSNEVNAKNIRLDLLTESDIEFVSGPTFPFIKTVQFVRSYDRLTLGGIQDKFFILAFLSGYQLRFRNPDTSPGDDATQTLTGTFKIRGISIPNDLEDVPETMTGDIAVILADLLRKRIKINQKPPVAQ